MKDYYQILEITLGTSQDDIKKQYRFLVQAWHPDKFSNPNQKAKAGEKLKDINEAYDILSDPTKRTQYDWAYTEEEQKRKRQNRQTRLFDIDEKLDSLNKEVDELKEKTPEMPKWWLYSIFLLILSGYAKSMISISMKESGFLIQAAIGAGIVILGIIFMVGRNRFYKTKRKPNLDLLGSYAS